ncbi:MAG: hypothetical protein QM308_01640 [Bacillota bacterium]|nr:hypothetical protein [Bacillota bacterium]
MQHMLIVHLLIMPGQKNNSVAAAGKRNLKASRKNGTLLSGGAAFSHISIPALAGANAAISTSDTANIAWLIAAVKEKDAA